MVASPHSLGIRDEMARGWLKLELFLLDFTSVIYEPAVVLVAHGKPACPGAQPQHLKLPFSFMSQAEQQQTPHFRGHQR